MPRKAGRKFKKSKYFCLIAAVVVLLAAAALCELKRGESETAGMSGGKTIDAEPAGEKQAGAESAGEKQAGAEPEGAATEGAATEGAATEGAEPAGADAADAESAPAQGDDIASVSVIEEIEAGADAEEAVGHREVALTFDDGPHSIYTPMLLDGLKERGVKATFFLMGLNVEGNEEIVKRISDEGHLIGNHTYSHCQLTAVGEDAALEEINRDTALLESITGTMIQYIRPPFGCYTDSLKERVGLKVVMWTIDPLDWSNQNARAVASHIISHAEDGSIILLHDIFKTSVEAAFLVIDTLTEQGYAFVRVDELGMAEEE